MIFFLEAFPQELGHFRLVFHYQETHRYPPPDTLRYVPESLLKFKRGDLPPGCGTRGRKVGTIVAERAQERPVFEIWDIADIVSRNGGTYQYRLIECRKLDDAPERREALGVSARIPVLWMRCLHLCDGKPFQLEERLINVDAAPGVTCQPLDAQSPGRWLLGHVPWTDAEHRISAREAPEEVAAQLDVRPQAACLVVDRRTWNNGAPVTFARLWHPGNSHNLVGHFKPAR